MATINCRKALFEHESGTVKLNKLRTYMHQLTKGLNQTVEVIDATTQKQRKINDDICPIVERQRAKSFCHEQAARLQYLEQNMYDTESIVEGNLPILEFADSCRALQAQNAKELIMLEKVLYKKFGYRRSKSSSLANSVNEMDGKDEPMKTRGFQSDTLQNTLSIYAQSMEGMLGESSIGESLGIGQPLDRLSEATHETDSSIPQRSSTSSPRSPSIHKNDNTAFPFNESSSLADHSTSHTDQSVKQSSPTKTNISIQSENNDASNNIEDDDSINETFDSFETFETYDDTIVSMASTVIAERKLDLLKNDSHQKGQETEQMKQIANENDPPSDVEEGLDQGVSTLNEGVSGEYFSQTPPPSVTCYDTKPNSTHTDKANENENENTSNPSAHVLDRFQVQVFEGGKEIKVTPIDDGVLRPFQSPIMKCSNQSIENELSPLRDVYNNRHLDKTEENDDPLVSETSIAFEKMGISGQLIDKSPNMKKVYPKTPRRPKNKKSLKLSIPVLKDITNTSDSHHDIIITNKTTQKLNMEAETIPDSSIKNDSQKSMDDDFLLQNLPRTESGETFESKDPEIENITPKNLNMEENLVSLEVVEKDLDNEQKLDDCVETHNLVEPETVPITPVTKPLQTFLTPEDSNTNRETPLSKTPLAEAWIKKHMYKDKDRLLEVLSVKSSLSPSNKNDISENRNSIISEKSQESLSLTQSQNEFSGVDDHTPINFLTVEEYCGAPRVVKMQVSFEEVNHSIKLLNGWLIENGYSGRVEISESDANVIIENLFTEQRKRKFILLSLCHWKRIVLHIPVGCKDRNFIISTNTVA